MRSSTYNYAQRELDILVKSSIDPENRPTIEPFISEILELADRFGKSGQSGGSAPMTATAISQAVKCLLLQEPICPITGIDDEWVNVAEYGAGKDERTCVWQNSRCSSLFKEGSGRAYYLDAIVWKGDTEGESGYDWDNFTGTVEGVLSRQYIRKFPFNPKTFYIDVTKEQLPEDWTEEPFIEGKDYYITSEFEKTGIKVWHKDKYRYKMKFPKQLEKVFKYYDRYE